MDLIDRRMAIKAIENLQDCYNGFSDTYDKACIIGVLEEVPSAQRWVPVTERLPKPNEKDEDGIQKYYLIQNEFGDMMVASYREKNLGDTWWEQMYAYKPIADKVIAWMPLPEPWRGSDNDG